LTIAGESGKFYGALDDVDFEVMPALAEAPQSGPVSWEFKDGMLQVGVSCSQISEVRESEPFMFLDILCALPTRLGSLEFGVGTD
jgi:hypothetical protein